MSLKCIVTYFTLLELVEKLFYVICHSNYMLLFEILGTV